MDLNMVCFSRVTDVDRDMGLLKQMFNTGGAELEGDQMPRG